MVIGNWFSKIMDCFQGDQGSKFDTKNVYMPYSDYI